ncbi:MAG: peroxiredoxin family protein [Deltaproteobacteria bacterium]|nr:peroxiredoxin family protein [Deltaproteobacteria bacterium]
MTPIKILKIFYTCIVLFGVALISLSGVSSLLDPHPRFGLQPASASNKYGILGRQAPELELSTWIDGNGRPMDPVKLKDYRGKVIYLYFFQDW